MRLRRQVPARAPFWHRSRLGWINALGFALTATLAVWLVLVAFRAFLPQAEPVAFAFPAPFAAVLGLAQLATVVTGSILVFGFMWRGADLAAHRPRLYVFFWTGAGLLFFLVQVVVLARFGRVDLPNAGGLGRDIYWGLAPVGLLAFALMAYVNIELPGSVSAHDDDHADWDCEWDADWDDDGEESGHAEVEREVARY